MKVIFNDDTRIAIAQSDDARTFVWYHSNEIYKDHIYPTPPLGQDMTQGQFLSLTGLNSEFSFS